MKTTKKKIQVPKPITIADIKRRRDPDSYKIRYILTDNAGSVDMELNILMAPNTIFECQYGRYEVFDINITIDEVVMFCNRLSSTPDIYESVWKVQGTRSTNK